MDELRGWWEVPTVAHFCYVFQAAFKLFEFQIEDLEAALLKQNDDEPCSVTTEQLAMSLLQGCAWKKNINVENWEEELWSRLRKDPSMAKQHASLLKEEKPFSNLELREKVEVLLSLCELRLSRVDVMDTIKKIKNDTLRLTPLGTDSKDNIYWYFFGIRLYKEDAKSPQDLSKKKASKSKQSKVVNGYKPTPSRSRMGSRVLDKPDVPSVSTGWCVVCYTLEDWESLVSSLRETRHPKDKKLSEIIEVDYIPKLQEEEQKRERLRRKALLELAPRRMSSRITQYKVKEEKLLQQQKFIVEEERRREELEVSATQEFNKHRAAGERARRAKLREMRLQTGDYSNGVDDYAAMLSSRKRRLSDEANSNSNTSSQSETPIRDFMENSYNARDEQVDASATNSSEEEDDDDSDTSFQPSTNKVRKSEVYQPTKPLVDITKLVSPANHANQMPSNRNFAQLSGLHMNGTNVSASILYNSYRTYSILPASPFYPTVPDVQQQ